MVDRSLIIPPLRKNGKNWLLVIGIDQYPDANIEPLGNAVRDAEAVAEVLRKRYGFEDICPPLLNEQATLGAIDNALESLTKVHKDDNVIIYFAGHGWYHRSRKAGYLIPVDAKAGQTTTYLSHSTLIEAIRAIENQHTFLILDSCFSGALLRNTEDSPLNRSLERLAQNPSRWALTAGQIETVGDGFHGGNSPFAQSVLHYLDKAAPDAFAISELVQYVKRTVPNNADQLPHAGILFKTGDLSGEMVLVQVRREADDWREAQTTNTLAGYEGFIAAHASSTFVREAEIQIAALREAEASALWQQIQRASWDDKKSLIKQFKEKYADSNHYESVLEEAIKVDDYAIWSQIKQNSENALELFILKNNNNYFKNTASEKLKLIKKNKIIESNYNTNKIITPNHITNSNTKPQNVIHVKNVDTYINREKRQNRIIKLLKENSQQKIYYFALIVIVCIIFLSLGVILIPDWGGRRAMERERLQQQHVNDSINKHKNDSINEKTKYILSQIQKKMILIKNDSFLMGTNTGPIDERPLHKSILEVFYISETEVTQEEFSTIMGENPSKFNDCPQCPVENVSWRDAKAFIAKLNILSGTNYRLPTEAEWEYAAGGGGQIRTQWAGTSNENELINYAWYGYIKSERKTHPVKTKKPNHLKIYDMAGNVWEWCEDIYNNKFYKNYYIYGNIPNTDSVKSTNRVLRGGSWYVDAYSCRISNRGHNSPDYRNSNVGFRLARFRGGFILN